LVYFYECKNVLKFAKEIIGLIIIILFDQNFPKNKIVKWLGKFFGINNLYNIFNINHIFQPFGNEQEFFIIFEICRIVEGHKK